MVQIGLVAALLAATVAAAPASSGHPSENFHLSTRLRCGGPSKFEGLYIGGFHTGAGENDLVASSESTSQAEAFNLTSGYVEALLGTPPSPYRWALNPDAPYDSGAPSEYKLITFGVDAETHGFSVDRNGDLAVNSGSFKTFVLCDVKGISPYFSVGPQTQLLWSSSFHEASDKSQCADVLLHLVA